MSTSLLLRAAQPSLKFCRNINCWRAGITKKHRKIYERTYPTVLVFPDGSSINIDYHEPRKIIFLPLNVATLSEEERRAILAKRVPKSKIIMDEEIDDDFDEGRYIKK